MEKNEAREKYDDAIAAGNTAVKMEENEDLPDILSLLIGNLKSGQKAIITINIVNKLTTVGDEFYNFIFPMNFIPKYKAAGSVKKKGSYVEGQFGIKINIKSNDNIHFINSKQNLKLKQINEKSFELKMRT